MLGSPYYHSLLKKYIIIFGTLFNNITIERENGSTKIERFKVPIAYGPREKHLARIRETPNAENDRAVAVQLPRMGFEITSLSYASERKLNTLNRLTTTVTNEGVKKVYQSVPYNLSFSLSIMAKTVEDCTRVWEQIIPYFKPEFTVSAKLLDDFDDITDIPITLLSTTMEDTYEGDFETRRMVVFNLDFDMKIHFWGPVTSIGLIKFIDVNFINQATNTNFSGFTIQPGLTANGEPTTDITETINYQSINPDDNWDYIIQIDT